MIMKTNCRNIAAVLAGLLMLTSPAVMAAAESLNLSGEWQFALDAKNVGVAEGWCQRNLTDKICLPGCLQEHGYGEKPGPDTLWWMGHNPRLAPAFPFQAR